MVAFLLLRQLKSTVGVCRFCARHKGYLFCEICELETDLSGDWVDGTRLVDYNLSLDFHDMGSFLISEVRGVRLAEKPRSDSPPHDRLEFRGIVRGCQPEERGMDLRPAGGQETTTGM